MNLSIAAEPAPSSVVLCPVCGRLNGLGTTHCDNCRKRLQGVGAIPIEEATRIEQARRAARIRRRLIRWGVVGGMVLGLLAWRLVTYFDPFLSLPDPTSGISAVPGPGEWPMYQRDPNHSALVTDQQALPEGVVKWSFKTDAPLKSAPAVVGGRVYLGTGDRGIVALDGESGDVLWEYHTEDRIESSPAVAGGLVFAGLLDRRVIALDQETGRLEWEFLTGNRVFSSPAVHGGTVYIGSGDGRLYALDALTGKERWSYQTNDSIIASPAVNEEVVAVLSQDKHLYILDIETGKRRLDYRMFFATGSPTLNGNTVVAADDKGFLRAIDWRVKEFPFEKAIRTLRFHVFWYGFTDDLPGQKGLVWGFQELGHTGVGTPVAALGNVYAGSASGTLFALDEATGQKVWEFDARAPLWAPPAVAGETVFVGDGRGKLHALDARTGKVVWQFQTGGAINATPVVADGLIYLASGDGTLYVIG